MLAKSSHCSQSDTAAGSTLSTVTSGGLPQVRDIFHIGHHQLRGVVNSVIPPLMVRTSPTSAMYEPKPSFGKCKSPTRRHRLEPEHKSHWRRRPCWSSGRSPPHFPQ